MIRKEMQINQMIKIKLLRVTKRKKAQAMMHHPIKKEKWINQKILKNG